MQEELKSFYKSLRSIYLLSTTAGLLSWDRSTLLQQKGQNFRAEQNEFFAGMIHEMSTDSQLQENISILLSQKENLSEDDLANVNVYKKDLDQLLKLPAEFVARKAKVCSQTESVWERAKKESNFKLVQPLLQQVIDLSREEANLLGFKDHPYDALLDNYEPDFTVALGNKLLIPLGKFIKEILPEVITKQSAFGSSLPSLAMNKNKQTKLLAKVARALNYNGIISESSHPFMTSLGPEDKRITVKYYLKNFTEALSNAMHEMGHALYEQGLPNDNPGSPLGSAVSMGIHESQSRFFENIIGRSLPFANYLTGILPAYYPKGKSIPTADQLYQSVNKVEPTLIRIYADEVTYNLHIIIRFILEQWIMKGELNAADLPEAWNNLYKEYLGITPDNDANGVLQDVHWYFGGIGYFPTYVLGNIYDGIILDSIKKDIPSFDDLILNGEFVQINDWLTQNIHQFGRKFSPVQLIEKIAKKEISSEPFIGYIKRKYLS